MLQFHLLLKCCICAWNTVMVNLLMFNVPTVRSRCLPIQVIQTCQRSADNEFTVPVWSRSADFTAVWMSESPHFNSAGQQITGSFLLHSGATLPLTAGHTAKCGWSWEFPKFHQKYSLKSRMSFILCLLQSAGNGGVTCKLPLKVIIVTFTNGTISVCRRHCIWTKWLTTSCLHCSFYLDRILYTVPLLNNVGLLKCADSWIPFIHSEILMGWFVILLF